MDVKIHRKAIEEEPMASIVRDSAFVLVAFTLFFFIPGVRSATFTFTNNCPYTVWPAALTGSGDPIQPTGFELKPGASNTLNAAPHWSGRFWARTQCSSDQTGKFTCLSGDCGSGQVTCTNSAPPPVSLVELTLNGDGGKDFYDTSLVDGFNVPLSLEPQGGDCKPTACRANINAVCPAELQVKGPDGGVVGCKSGCAAFNTPELCCSGDHNTPEKCGPSQYSKIFKAQCPDAYSYAYDDKTSTFTCPSGVNYAVKFCP